MKEHKLFKMNESGQIKRGSRLTAGHPFPQS